MSVFHSGKPLCVYIKRESDEIKSAYLRRKVDIQIVTSARTPKKCRLISEETVGKIGVVN